jgi:hypothetical protein
MGAVRPPAFAALLAALMLAACGSDTASSNSTDPGEGGVYAPEIDPADFSDIVDNPFMPLQPGARWVYEERTADGEVEEIVVEFTPGP